MTDSLIVMPDFWATSSPQPGATNVLVAAPAPWQGARVGKCYNNVQAMVSQRGGEAVYGWALTDYGPHRAFGGKEPPLYRRWLNHVVWRDPEGQLREVSPNAVIGNYEQQEFLATEFVPDPSATFEIISDEVWFTRPTRYVPLRPEGVVVTDLLTQAQLAIGDSARHYWLREALTALAMAGFRPREWKVETVGQRTGSIWLIAE